MEVIQPVYTSCNRKLWKICGTSPIYENRENVHINMLPETFHFRVLAERILYMHYGAPANLAVLCEMFSVTPIMPDGYVEEDPLHGLHPPRQILILWIYTCGGTRNLCICSFF
jgi:hypothetical protein